METELEKLKAKITIIEKAHTGVSEYLMVLDEKLKAGVNGIDSKGVAELQDIVDNQSRSLSITATELSEI